MSEAIAEQHPQPQSWDARHKVAAEVFVPWVDRVYPLAGKTALEYGSGGGAVSCAFAARATRVIGYDIDAGAVGAAAEYARERGLDNVEARTTTPERIFDEVRSHVGEIDVFLLYAVLEHLTIDERLRALRLATEVVRPDGVIAVIETPNRLIDMDYHTSQLPFFDQLPAELALQYADRSERADFRDPVVAARDRDPDGGALTLARWGRGLSYHEFELVFGDLSERVLAGGYDPDLLEERKLHTEELALARQLERVRPDLPPPFSRYWLDMLISPRPVDPVSVRMVRPWSLETASSKRAKFTVSDTVVLKRRQALRVPLPIATGRIVCVLTSPVEELQLTVTAGGARQRETLRGRPGYPLIADIRLARGADELALRTSNTAHVQLVGYERASA
jgi:SAM-dependent methyltransferase